MTIDTTAVLWFLLDLALRAVLAAAAAALVLRTLRIRAAALRHSVWTTVLAAMLLMPILPSIVPALPMPALPSMAPNPDPASERETELAPPPRITEPAASRSTAIGVFTPDIATAMGPRAEQPRPSSDRRWWPLGLVSVYALGVVVFLSRLSRGWLLVAGLRRRARSTGPLSLRPALAIGSRGGAVVYQSPEVAAPLTAGALRPIVILPARWREWTPDVLAAVIAHEMAHVRRRDALVLLLARLNRAVFWFHPLAWWLERQLAVTAEHACDEVASAAVPEPRRYAEILVEMADAVRRHSGRVAWQAVGVDGAGVLEGRIDRVLRGSFSRTSRARASATLLMCAAAIVVVVACRQGSNVPALREDPDLAKRLVQQDENVRKSESARDMTQAQADELEKKLEANPQDFDVRRQLVIYYSQSSQVAWDKKVPGLRRHALWLIEHHPEHDVRPPGLSPQFDPEGFAAAKKLWDAHLAKPDASPYLVYRAALFFLPSDKPYAEALIRRGMKLDPESKALAARLEPNVGGYQWDMQLATLYASALRGSENAWGTYNDLRTREEFLKSPYAEEVRAKLAASTDARLLVRVGSYMTRGSPTHFPPGPERDRANALAEKIKNEGVGYLQRALQLDPNLDSAKRALYLGSYREATNDATRAASDARRAYSRGDLAEAKRLAEEAVKMAQPHPGDNTYSRAFMEAHHLLAMVAVKAGDSNTAVRHLQESVNVPASDEIRYATPFSWAQPVNALLKAGERERVAAFLDAFGQLVGTGPEAERLRNDAKAIREGRMPAQYQHVTYRETAPSPFKPMR